MTVAAAALLVSAAQLVSPRLGVVGVANVMARQHARVLVTIDAGAHFREIGPRVRRDTVVDDVAFLDRLHGWVVVWNVDTVRARLYRTADGGRTWRSVEVPSHGAHAGASDTIRFFDRRDGRLVVQEPTAPFASLFATRDGGARWHAVAHLPEVAPVRFQDARVAWQGGGPFAQRLYRSGDGGRHWRRVPLPSSGVVGLPASVAGGTDVAVTSFRPGRTRVVVYRSEDGGRRWRRVSTLSLARRRPAGCTLQAAGVTFASARVWWLAAHDRSGPALFRTRDGGARWTRVPVPARGCSVPTVLAAGPVTAWLESAGRLYATRDAGATWTPLRP